MKLAHVLSRTANGGIDPDRLNADLLKRIARFWVGKEANTFRKTECIVALQRAFKSETSCTAVVLTLSDIQRQVLSVFARYGPALSGAVLSAELCSRGLLKADNESFSSSYYARSNGPVSDLIEKLVLLKWSEDESSYYSFYDRRYPDLMLHPSLATLVQASTPLPWAPSGKGPTVKSTHRRSSAEVALDLWRVAAGLQDIGAWATVKGGALSKGTRNRVRKLVPMDSAVHDPLSPPDPESLYYELLRGMGFLSLDDKLRNRLEKQLEDHLQQPAAVQAWRWVRAWLDMRLWQDGIGVVPDRDTHEEPVRIQPSGLRTARELLVWALCRIAHSANEWLEIETFVRDLWQATREHEIDFYWSSYTWDPGFDMGKRKESFSGDERRLAYWLAAAGGWVSNVVMVTLVTLGLVERGQSSDTTPRLCFRLTDLGRVVFGAPETQSAPRNDEMPFLTVQPNMDVLAYLDQADAARMCTLARFAARTSRAGGRVQTFGLRRESVYRALESGMTLDVMTSFLMQNSKTECPGNVVRLLSEWAGKRESLILRTHVTLLCDLGPKPSKRGRMLGDQMMLLPNVSRLQAGREYSGWTIVDHQEGLRRMWTAEELGRITVTGRESIGEIRLAMIADEGRQTQEGWQVSERSIARAKRQGLTAEQILGWLRDHLRFECPPVLEMAIRNRTGRASIFAGKVQMLQIARPQARDAILKSVVFAPLLAGHIPPDWFVVRDEHAGEVKRLLKTLGFSISDSYQLPSLDE